MKTLIVLVVCLLLVGVVSAQEQTHYEIALERILEAEASGATELDLSNLRLTELPPEIGNLVELRLLLLHTNHLTELPDEIGQLENLLFIDIGYNNLLGFPASIGNLVKLERLNAGRNQISSLPAEFGGLQSLRHLELWGNEFTEFPLVLTELPPSFLSMAGNQISEIPTEIARLDNLCFLDLGKNQIEVLPRELAELDGLLDPVCPTDSYVDGLYYTSADLFIGGNPLIFPPDEVIVQGTPAILEYLRNEAWWHLQKLIVSGLGILGLVTLSVLGFRWRNRRGKQKRKQVQA